MPNGYIELPLSGRLFGQQIEYATTDDFIKVPDIQVGGTTEIDGLIVIGVRESGGTYTTIPTATIRIGLPEVEVIQNDERLDYGDQIFTLKKAGTETAVFTVTDQEVNLALEDYDWVEVGAAYEAEWKTSDTSGNLYYNTFDFTILPIDDFPKKMLQILLSKKMDISLCSIYNRFHILFRLIQILDLLF